MNLQFVLVVIILLGAASYAAVAFWKKTKAFSPRSGCGSDCGCGNKKEPRHS